MGLLSEKDWDNARWIAFEKDKTDEIITTGLHGLTNIDNTLKGKKTGLYKLPQFEKSSPSIRQSNAPLRMSPDWDSSTSSSTARRSAITS